MRKYKLVLIEEKLNDRLEPTDRRIIMNDQIIELNDSCAIDCVNFLCNDLINHYINFCQNDNEFMPIKLYQDTKWQKLKEYINMRLEEYKEVIDEYKERHPKMQELEEENE